MELTDLFDEMRVGELGRRIRELFPAVHFSLETMLDAQIHPEKHRDLIVRVAGYSAFFNVLSRQTQDDIIARTEQSL
jgi:autonomous glycyl radical cofactor GrcA